MGADRRNDMAALVVIALATAALYGHTLQVPWYFDDFAAIVGNPALHSFAAAWENLAAPRGVALFSFALNYRFGGLAVPGYHLVNIVIHAGAAVLVYLLLKRALDGDRLPALLGALLFAAHPLQTQAVTYIVQRMASLCGFFFLLTLYCFVRARAALADGGPWRARPHLGWYAAALAAAALAVFTKENAVVLPVALLLFGSCFPPRGAAPPLPLRYLAPFLLVPALVAVQQLLLPLAGGDAIARLAGFHQHGALSPLHYLVTEFSVLWIYLRLLVLPYGQALDYGYPVVQTLLTLQNVAALAGLLGLGAVAWWLRRRQPLVACGIAWFFLTLAVESSFIPLDPLFEHRLYLPMFGFVLVVVGLLRWLLPQRLAVTALAAIVLVLAPLTWQRNRLWNDPLAFYADNLRHAPQAAVAWYNLFGRYVQAGRLDEAEGLLRGSRFAYFDSYLSLANAYLQQGRADKARQHGEAALAINPAQPAGYLLLAEVALHEGQPPAALAVLQRGLAANPNSQELQRRVEALAAVDLPERFARAQTLHRQGRSAEALQEYVRIALLDPANGQALFNAGVIAGELGDQAALVQLRGRLRIVNPALAAELERKLRASARP